MRAKFRQGPSFTTAVPHTPTNKEKIDLGAVGEYVRAKTELRCSLNIEDIHAPRRQRLNVKGGCSRRAQGIPPRRAGDRRDSRRLLQGACRRCQGRWPPQDPHKAIQWNVLRQLHISLVKRRVVLIQGATVVGHLRRHRGHYFHH